MGHFGDDTAIIQTDEHRFQARLTDEWSIWGPHGGFLATLALRAAGAVTRLDRPCTIHLQYVNVADFGEAELEVTSLRATRRAECLRVDMRQGDKLIMEASVRTVAADSPGPDCRWSPMPTLPEPTTMARVDFGQRFWSNFEIRIPPGIVGEDGADPVVAGWQRFVPQATFPDDPWLDAGRSLVALDTAQFPAIARAFEAMTFIAPTLDYSVSFHQPVPDDVWLAGEARGVHAGGGLIAGSAALWGESGALTATGTQQMLCRPLG
ncbi:MAG: thioesterase family protein [Actinobacteria bacterium]|nr:thioesterase family protein [Actinomycetota bacterium]